MTVEGARSGLWRSPPVWVSTAALLGIGIFLIQQPHSEIWVRVGLALMLFVLPGGLLFSFVPLRSPLSLVDFAGYGFAVSLVLISVLGLLARTLHWTFDAIQLIWFGLTALSACAFLFAPKKRMRVHLKKPSTSTIALTVIVLVHIALFAYSGVFNITKNFDQHNYNAEVLSFLREGPLDFLEAYLETGNPLSDRLYFTYWTLAQALMVDASGVHILHAQYILNSAVIVLAVIATCIFSRNLGHSPKTALVIVILTLLCYSLLLEQNRQPGAQFFMRPIEDKLLAGFVLAPIAISTAYHCSAAPRRAAYFAFALSFLAIVFAHTMIAGFVLAAIGLWCLLRILADKQGRGNAVRIGLITLILAAPVIFLRLNTDARSYNFGDAPLESNRNLRVFNTINPLDGGNPFYAINPNAAGGLTYVLLALVVLAAAWRRLDAKSRLMLALALTAGFGLLPFTAWIYGRLVSVQHMMRVLWLIPYGYMLFFVLATAAERLAINPSRLLQDKVLVPLLSLTVLPTALFLSAYRGVDFSRDMAAVFDGERDWLQVAEYIEAQHDERVRVLGSPDYRNRVLSLSSKAVTVSYYDPQRMFNYSGLSLEQATAQTNDHRRFFAADASIAERLAVIDEYDVAYLLFSHEYDERLQPLLDDDPARFELVHAGDVITLVKISDCCLSD